MKNTIYSLKRLIHRTASNAYKSALPAIKYSIIPSALIWLVLVACFYETFTAMDTFCQSLAAKRQNIEVTRW